MTAKLAKNTGCRKFAITPPMIGMTISAKVIAIQPAQSAIHARGRARKSAKPSMSHAAPRPAPTSATRMVPSISVERLRERLRVRDVVLEEAAGERVVLGDRHVRVAREVVVSQAAEPGAQRRAPQHHRPEAALEGLERAQRLVARDERVGALLLDSAFGRRAPVVH